MEIELGKWGNSLQLPTNCGVHGSVIAEQVRTIDLQQSWWKSMEIFLPGGFVDEVVEIFSLLIL